PGASVGCPGGGSYIANPGSIPVTFVPSGTNGDTGAGTYFADPAEVAAAVGPGGVLTDQLMAQLSGHPYRAGPPTAIQMAIIDAARQAGLRLGTAWRLPARRTPGPPHRAGPPTAIQMAIIDAARQAGLRLGTS